MNAKNSGNIIFAICLTGYSFLFFTSCIKTNVPPTQSNQGNLKSVVASATNATLMDTALTRAGLDSLYTNGGPFTLFVATDQAFLAAGITNAVFDKLPDSVIKRIVLYNTLFPAVGSSQLPAGPDAGLQTNSGDSIFISNDGSGVYVNGILIESFDLLTNNGNIDAVAQLLLPPSGTILQIAQADTSFSYFDTAVARTSAGDFNIGSILASGNVYTLFLPTNDAFRSAGYATPADISAADPDTLGRVLLYHILPGRAFTSDFVIRGDQKTLLNNETIAFGLVGSGAYGVIGNGNTAPLTLIASNIMASNGVIQVIGQFLKP